MPTAAPVTDLRPLREAVFPWQNADHAVCVYADEITHQKRDPSEPDIETVSIVRLSPLRCVAVGVIAHDGRVRLALPTTMRKSVIRALSDAATSALAAIVSGA